MRNLRERQRGVHISYGLSFLVLFREQLRFLVVFRASLELLLVIVLYFVLMFYFRLCVLLSQERENGR